MDTFVDSILLCRLWLSYSTAVGLAGQSAVYESAMRENLLQMAAAVAKASELQSSAEVTSTTAEETLEKAAADRAESEALQAQGEALLAEAEADQAAAEADEASAGELAAAAAEEAAAAEADYAKVAAEEVLVEEDVAKATADAAKATRDGFRASEDEVAVGACELVPVLDLVCDIVGGAAAIGLETVSAGEAARAASEYAAAVAVQSAEDTQVAEATELAASAGRDGDLAAESTAAAGELQAKAGSEVAEGEATEAAAEEELAQSTAEEATAEEEEVEAAAEEEQAGQYWAKSVEAGAGACWNAILSGLLATAAFGYFAIRIMASAVIPGIHVAVLSSSGSAAPAAWVSVRLVSHCLHHVLILGAVAGLFRNKLLLLDQVDVRTKGGIVLELAISTAAAQALALHCHSHAGVMESVGWKSRACTGLVLWLRATFVLALLVVIEVLLLLVIVGPDLFSAPLLGFLRQWYVWAALSTSLIIHFWCIDRREWKAFSDQDSKSYVSDVEEERLLSSQRGAKPWYGASETEADWLPIEDQKAGSRKRINPLWTDMKRLVLPFEMLVAACMFALLRSCLPNVKLLWEASHPLIVGAHPHWRRDGIIVGSIVVAIAAAWVAWPRRRS